MMVPRFAHRLIKKQPNLSDEISDCTQHVFDHYVDHILDNGGWVRKWEGLNGKR